METLKSFYERPAADRPDTADCLFVSTHEPCSLCLSAITWAGFDNFFYLFGYQDTKDAFNIPHDLRILQQVFAIDDGHYRRQNEFWSAYAITDLASQLPVDQRDTLTERIARLNKIYADLSDIYQSGKQSNDIPLR